MKKFAILICLFLTSFLYMQSVKTISFNNINEKVDIKQRFAFSEITDNFYLFSIYDGVVSKIEKNAADFYLIEIMENSGYTVQYFDILLPLVDTGQKISKGEKIGKIPPEKYGDILIFYSRRPYYEYDFSWPKIQFRFEIKAGMGFFACEDGIVTINGYSPEKGRYLRIKNNNFIIEYFNLNTTKVLKGTQVKQGELIGTSGLTGKVTIPSISYTIFSISGEEFLPIFIFEPVLTKNSDKE